MGGGLSNKAGQQPRWAARGAPRGGAGKSGRRAAARPGARRTWGRVLQPPPTPQSPPLALLSRHPTCQSPAVRRSNSRAGRRWGCRPSWRGRQQRCRPPPAGRRRRSTWTAGSCGRPRGGGSPSLRGGRGATVAGACAHGRACGCRCGGEQGPAAPRRHAEASVGGAGVAVCVGARLTAGSSRHGWGTGGRSRGTACPPLLAAAPRRAWAAPAPGSAPSPPGTAP